MTDHYNQDGRDIERTACQLIEFLTGLSEGDVIQLVGLSQTLPNIRATLAEQKEEYITNLSKQILRTNLNPTVSELEILVTLVSRFLVHLHREQERVKKIKSEMMSI